MQSETIVSDKSEKKKKNISRSLNLNRREKRKGNSQVNLIGQLETKVSSMAHRSGSLLTLKDSKGLLKIFTIHKTKTETR